MFLVLLTVCTGIPQMALAQWGGSSYYSDYYYSEDVYSSSGDCGCGGSGGGWTSYIPYIGGCNNKIEVDDRLKVADPTVLAAK